MHVEDEPRRRRGDARAIELGAGAHELRAIDGDARLPALALGVRGDASHVELLAAAELPLGVAELP